MAVRPIVRRGAREQPSSSWRIGGVVLAICIAIALVAAAALHDRRAQLAHARAVAAGQIAALGSHAVSLVDGLELALDKVEQQIQGRDPGDVRADPAVFKLLSGLQSRFSLAESVFAVDATGRTLVSSRAFPVPPYDVRDREFLIAAKAGHDGLYVSQPYRAQMARDISFVLSRPMVRDGKFAGVVAATLSPTALQVVYGKVLGASGAGAVLARADGVVLMRSSGGPKWPDRLPELSDLMKAAGTQDSGMLAGTSLVEGERVLYAFRALRDRKLIVAVALRESDMLAPWYTRTLIYGGGIAAAALGFLAWTIPWRTWSREPRSSWFAPRGLPMPNRDARADASARSLTPSAVRVLNVLVDRLRGLLAADEPLGADRVAALVQALLGFAARRAPQPRLVDIAGVVSALPGLLAGAGGPTLRIPDRPEDANALVFADPDQLALALVDCALSLAAADPTAQPQHVQAEVVTIGSGEVDGLTAGTYVCVALIAAGRPAPDMAPQPFPVGAVRKGDALFGLAADYAPDLWAVAVTIGPAEGRRAMVQLWLPEADAGPEAIPSEA